MDLGICLPKLGIESRKGAQEFRSLYLHHKDSVSRSIIYLQENPKNHRVSAIVLGSQPFVKLFRKQAR